MVKTFKIINMKDFDPDMHEICETPDKETVHNIANSCLTQTETSPMHALGMNYGLTKEDGHLYDIIVAEMAIIRLTHGDR